ncbi:uncharacterized protein BX663DRAFT_483150 [Cokeromyces recurvatus]|uniref:uncharacterized protein n=1 Tax=Cokeromyces recurvatus TaxID=90255 RepID=UPI00221F20D5|nr:uncharacterized protein BX663DRAFT_483150 [Cokeromyces recurvatus]KAI7906404.1 hypothetical protein BX663DRAFT_483150 [Cokeromyces recurvatus]
MIEEPPPLPFPSLQSLKTIAIDILKLQRSLTTPEVEFRFFEPEEKKLYKTEQKKPNNKACEVCKKKKIRCDINAFPNEKCTRTNCQCLHHHHQEEEIKQEEEEQVNQLLIETYYSSSSTQHLKLNKSIPSTTVFRKPGLLSSCHYTGETSFCGYLPVVDQPPVIKQESDFPDFQPVPKRPILSIEDQYYLIDVYYENMNPFYPLINKQDLLKQLECITKKEDSYLSPLFFYALFARASHLETNRKVVTSDNKQTLLELGTDCMNYVSALVDCYTDKPRVSTVLALIIMINHLEQAKLYQHLTKCWLWAGKAFKMALDLGIHRASICDEKSSFGQLCIRTFWLAYITDCTISMTYGRPSSTEEKVLDVTYPTTLPNDEDVVVQWINELNCLISLSKVTARVVKFNYCPPPPYIIQGPVKRHNAFLVSVDSWLIDIIHPQKEPESPMSNLINFITEETHISRRMEFQKKLFLYINLILLHRPYVDDTLSIRNTSSRPSYEICSYAAIIITDTASKLDYKELMYHSKSPLIAYSLIMALRIHILNASTSNSEKYNANKNFQLCFTILSKLPQTQDTDSMLYDTLCDLQNQYNNRFLSILEIEDDKQTTAAHAIFNSNILEKRKDIGQHEEPNMSVTITTNSGPSIVIKEHQVDNIGRKKKKAKTAGPVNCYQHQSTLNESQQLKQKNKYKQSKPIEICLHPDQQLQRKASSSFQIPFDQKCNESFITTGHNKEYDEEFIKNQIFQLFEEQPAHFQHNHTMPVIDNNNNSHINVHFTSTNPLASVSTESASPILEYPFMLQQQQDIHPNNSSLIAQNNVTTVALQQNQDTILDENNIDLTLEQIQLNAVSFFQSINHIFMDHYQPQQPFLVNQSSINVSDNTFATYRVEAQQENRTGITITRSSDNGTYSSETVNTIYPSSSTFNTS